MKNNPEILTTQKYQWSQSWADPFTHTDIDIVIAELTEIQEVRGQINPEIIVESAKNKSSILHKYFQWDDAKAAHKYRVERANQLLRKIEIVIVTDGKPKTIRVYETISRNDRESAVTLKRFDHLTPVDILAVKRIFISDLRGLKTRMERYNIFKAIVFIEQAIQAIQADYPCEILIPPAKRDPELILSDK